MPCSCPRLLCELCKVSTTRALASCISHAWVSQQILPTDALASAARGVNTEPSFQSACSRSWFCTCFSQDQRCPPEPLHANPCQVQGDVWMAESPASNRLTARIGLELQPGSDGPTFQGARGQTEMLLRDVSSWAALDSNGRHKAYRSQASSASWQS